MAKELTTEERDDRDRRQREKIRARQQAERDQAQRERDAHAAEVATQAETGKTELIKAMKALSEPEQRQVRLVAYTQILSGGWGTPNNLQQGVDEMCLRLARYVTTGNI